MQCFQKFSSSLFLAKRSLGEFDRQKMASKIQLLHSMFAAELRLIEMLDNICLALLMPETHYHDAMRCDATLWPATDDSQNSYEHISWLSP